MSFDVEEGLQCTVGNWNSRGPRAGASISDEAVRSSLCKVRIGSRVGLCYGMGALSSSECLEDIIFTHVMALHSS